MRWRRWIVPILIVCGIVAALVWSLRPQPVPVDVVEVKRAPLRVTAEEEGKTRVKEQYVISSPTTGRMSRINLDEGDQVRSGQLIATVAPLPSMFLDPRTREQGQAAIAAAESQIAAARERVRAARVNSDYWEGELKRTAQLMQSGDIARARHEQVLAEQRRAAAALSEAEAAVEAARAEMRRAQAALSQPERIAERGAATLPVMAPAAGRILRLIRKSEGPVTAGEPLVEIGDARAIEVEVELLSTDAVKVEPGTRVLFTRWGGDTTLEGIVQRIEPSGRTKISALGVEEQRVPVIVDIVSPESGRKGLGAGYRVEAAFILREEQNILQIPSSAVFQHQGGSAVFIVEEGFARRRPVKIGLRAGLMVQVLEGLQPGEKVVAHPDATIEDGVQVEPR